MSKVSEEVIVSQTERRSHDHASTYPDMAPAHAAPGSADERIKHRIWLVACCLALAVLAFTDRPGNILADTKLDMAVDPAAFLRRALHLWDQAQFGLLQNQAAGYFFPMGPFFILGKLLALPPWVVQRLWLTAIYAAAFLGVVRLSGRLGIGTPASRIAAGLAYALAPRGLSLFGILSSEFLPAAMLPWILLPLVRVMRAGRSMRAGQVVRAVCQSAVAVALCGGINATATIAVLIVPVIYLLLAQGRQTQGWQTRRLPTLACWVPAVAIATWWWAIPLVLFGAYGVSLLPYTESAATTTAVTSLANTLRGTEDWVNYLVVDGRPWWPVAFWIANHAVPIILTGVVAGLGLTGLVRPRLPERRFLLAVLLAGILIISTGYVSGLGNPIAGHLDQLVNGPLSPIRNLRKFDPLIRLPITLGLAHLLATVRIPQLRQVATVAAAAAIAIIAVPAYVSGSSQVGDFPAIPQYWQSAATWLNRHAGDQGVLAEPGARFGEYVWGRPLDDVLEALYSGNWASRQLSSIGSVGNERLLDAIDNAMAAGDGSSGLTQVLRRIGIRYIIVRNDLIRSDLRGAWPGRIHQAIDESPGIVKVAEFGRLPVGSINPDDATNADPPYPPVEIYQVLNAQPVAAVLPAAPALRVYGAPESLLTLANQGLLGSRPVLLNADDRWLHASKSVLTDSLRRRVRDFGEIRSNYSATLTASGQASTFEATNDYLERSWLPYLSVARYQGISNVTASSSAADINAIPDLSATGRLPFAALDGDLHTMWESGTLRGPVGQWIKIQFERAIDPGRIAVAFTDDPVIGPPVTQVRVSTATGQLTIGVRATGGYQQLQVPPGASSWLRLQVTRTQPGPTFGRQVGIAEIAVPGVAASRTIVAPAAPSTDVSDPTAVVLSKAEPWWSGCMTGPRRWICSPDLVRPTEEQYGFDHSFTLPYPSRATMRGTALLVNPGLVERYAWLGKGQPVVTASSTFTSDPQDQGASAFDANPATTWIAGAADRQPELTIGWAGQRTVREVTITRPPGATSLTNVALTDAKGQLRGGLLTGTKSTLRFAPLRTSRLTLAFTPSVLPLQITDVAIPRVRPLIPAGLTKLTLPCGFGPTVRLNGRNVPTRVTGTFADVLGEQPLSFAACSPLRLAAGQNRVAEPAQDGFDVQAVTLNLAGRGALTPPGVSAGELARTNVWTSSSRVLTVAAPVRSYLVVNENFNPGWRAVANGRPLRAVQLDGWRQGWLLPAGTYGVVTLTYPPDATYRANLFGGLGALLLLLLVAALPVRRTRPEYGTQVLPAPVARRRGIVARLGAAACWVAALSAAGFWVGGYLGAVVLPAATAIFMTSLALRARSVLWLWVAWPPVVGGLLLAASIVGALGDHLVQAGDVGTIVTTLSDSVPQLLGIVIIGRVAAAFLTSDRAAGLPRRDVAPADAARTADASGPGAADVHLSE